MKKKSTALRLWWVVFTSTATAAAIYIALFCWPAETLAPGVWKHEPKIRITVAAVGDLVMHMPLVNSVKNAETGRYDFSRIFAPIIPYLRFPDYTVANLETKLAGSRYGYRGYPLFNTPVDLAEHLRNSGVDLVTTANNHTLDYGWDGIVTTLNNLDAAGLAHTGTYRSPAEKAVPFIANIGGIRVCFLNYTATTNGLPVPTGKPFAVNILDRRAVVEETYAARKQGADLVVAMLHFGAEYQRQPDASQRRLAADLFAAGVDAIIGTHPHVVQPIEKVTVNRDGDLHTCIAAYSLGNFVSNQRYRYSDSGIILYLHIEKAAGKTRIRGVEYLPLWVHRSAALGRRQFRVLPVHPEITPETDLPLTTTDNKRIAQVWEELFTHLNDPASGIVPYHENLLRSSKPPESIPTVRKPLVWRLNTVN
ncbi:MAG: CapA family protein [Bacillota bacterium]